MSVEATRYVWELDLSKYTKRSAKRLVLLALADRANKEGTCFPSVARICEDTCMDRKTVMSTITDLISIGIIEDTGSRKGATMQVRVLKFKEISHRAVPNLQDNGVEFPDNSGKNGTGNLKEPKIKSKINNTENVKISFNKVEKQPWIPKHLYAQQQKDLQKFESLNKELIISEAMRESFNEGMVGNKKAVKGIPEHLLNDPKVARMFKHKR